MPPEPYKNKFWIYAAIFVVIIILVLAGQAVLSRYMDGKRIDENFEKAEKYTRDLETALKNDTYGGKTPQETLDMFIDALKKGDIDLASKYFALDTDVNSPDYLTRRKWGEGLLNSKSTNKIDSVISSVQATHQTSASESNAIFEYINKEGITETLIELEFNKFSSVWKIESL